MDMVVLHFHVLRFCVVVCVVQSEHWTSREPLQRWWTRVRSGQDIFNDNNNNSRKKTPLNNNSRKKNFRASRSKRVGELQLLPSGELVKRLVM